MTRGEFIIPTTCGFATRGRNYTIPTPPPEGIEALLSSELFNTKERVTTYFAMLSDLFSNKITIVHF